MRGIPAWVGVGVGWVCRGRRIVCRWIWRLLAILGTDRHTSRQPEEKKTALVAALCPAQARPALVAKAGRPLELSLEGSILPRHGCAGTTTKERPGARTFSNRLFDCTFSHSHILSPCQPQTALFPLFRPQTSSPIPSATPRPILEVDQMCPSPIVAAKISPVVTVPAALDVGRGAATVNLTKSMCPHHFDLGAKREYRYQPVHPAIPVPPSPSIAESFQDCPTTQ